MNAPTTQIAKTITNICSGKICFKIYKLSAQTGNGGSP